MMEEDARRLTLELLAARSPDATICPSEVARAFVAARDAGGGSGDWRGAMPIVHAAVERLLAEDLVQLSWKGGLLDARAGPYRIARHRRVGAT